MSAMAESIHIAVATEADIPDLLAMARHEAEYERMIDQFTATENSLREKLFGPQPAAQALIARADNQAVGFTVFFSTFSTFSATFGLYMEDLFVEEQWRAKGVGRKLLSHLASLDLKGNHTSITWSVFKWNQNAIRFYKSIGGEELKAWDHFSLSGSALQNLANGKS